MRRAMAEAEVGDDVYLEDPPSTHLNGAAADSLAKTPPFSCNWMHGQSHRDQSRTHHGDEVICEERSHVNLYRTGINVRNCRLHATRLRAAKTAF